MEKIYILKKNKLIRGPYTYMALQIRGIKEDDKIWYEGLKDWTPVVGMDGFKEIVKAKVPVRPGATSFLNKFFAFLR